MIPGSGTKADRFVQFQHDLNRVENKQGNYPHSMLEVTVNPNGRLVYKGKVSKLDRHPIITIAFSHNNDNYMMVKRVNASDDADQEQVSDSPFFRFRAFQRRPGMDLLAGTLPAGRLSD